MNAPLSKKSIRIIAQLSDRWRVVEAPPYWFPQRILQRLESRARAKSDGWVAKAYCTTREALARNIREYCGQIDPTAMATINALPDDAAA